jgi:hypothetical protein
MSENNFKPDSCDWYSATLRDVYPSRGYIVAQLDNGELVWVREMALTFKQHYYCLPLGTEMSVRIAKQDHPAYSYKAIEAQIQADVNAPATHEEVVITHWTYKFGGVKRSCGCGLFARFNSRHDGTAFQVGETILVDVHFSEERGDFIGTVVTEEEEF